MNRLRRLLAGPISTLWHADAPLTFVGLLMLAALVAFGVGLLLDPRTIAGAPAWMKPAKFALSTALYCLTLAWVFTRLPAWLRTRQVVGWTTAVVVVLEVGIIALQAWRGTTSHFNVSTAMDTALFAVMGVAILLQTIASGFVAVALFRQHFDDRALGFAMRAGMVITILGASSAGLMTRMTADQTTELHETGRLSKAGAHTVGAPDGGAGLPVIGWSRQHGDLRVPHFVGLHALQILPLVALLARRRTAHTAVRIVRIVTASYGALFVILLIQALNGEPLVAPGSTTLMLFVVWALGTAAALWTVTGRLKAATASAYTGVHA